VREGPFVLVHAGLLPGWTAVEAEAVARETEGVLRGPDGSRLLAAFQKKEVERWQRGLAGRDRIRAALAGFSRLRTLARDGRPCAEFSGPPAEAPRGCRPWYELRRGADGETVVFGHWAALGFRRLPGAVCLDSGCAWGRALTALRLDDGAVFEEPAGE
jgi:bis(5'-nucleosyl)-tetraphosphatase (symmetrical)